MTKTSEVNKKHNRRGTNRYFISTDIYWRFKCCWMWTWQHCIKKKDFLPKHINTVQHLGQVEQIKLLRAQIVQVVIFEQRLKTHKTREEHKYKLYRWDKKLKEFQKASHPWREKKERQNWHQSTARTRIEIQLNALIKVEGLRQE